MGILWGLTAALAWGIADFLIKPVATKLGEFRALFFVELVSLAPLLAYFSLSEGDLAAAPLPILGLTLLIGFLNLLGTLFLYRAYVVGEISIVSPIVSAYAVVSVGLALIVLAERPKPAEATGIVLALAGVALASSSWSALRHQQEKFLIPGLGWALAAAASFGLTFFLVDYVIDDTGPILPIIAFRLASLVGILALKPVVSSFSLRLPERGIWPLLMTVAVLDSVAYLTYNLGLSTAYVSIVATLASLYSLVTVLLAVVFLRERMEINQRIGVAAVFAGIVFLFL